MSKAKLIKWKVPSRKQPVWKGFSKVLKLIYKKPQIINLNSTPPKKAIYVANHAGASGPAVYSVYFPQFVAIWGAHQMLGNYGMRYKYYRDVFCIQKKGYGKVKATLLALPVALLNKMVYRGMKVLPTYQDGRFRDTIKNTLDCLDHDVSVMIFPENSEDGYHDVITEFLPGFVMAANRYDKTHDDNIPICPVYVDLQTNTLVIGKPSDLSDKQDWSREQICEHYRDQVNGLFHEYVEPKRKAQEMEKLAKKSKKRSKKQAVDQQIEDVGDISADNEITTNDVVVE